MLEPNIFELLDNAEKVLAAQRETLSDEEKIKFDKELKDSNFNSLRNDLSKQLSGLNSQFENILKSK